LEEFLREKKVIIFLNLFWDFSRREEFLFLWFHLTGTKVQEDSLSKKDTFIKKILFSRRLSFQKDTFIKLSNEAKSKPKSEKFACRVTTKA
jgi:hypothetical protein